MMDNYNDNREFRILGLPEKTKYGIIKPFKVKQYPKIAKYLPLLKSSTNKTKSNLLQLMIRNYDNKEQREQFENLIKSEDLVFFIRNNTFQIKQNIDELLDIIFEKRHKKLEDVIFNSDEEWNVFRKKVLDINGFSVDDNEEEREKSDLERLFDTAEEVINEKKGLATDFDAMYTSILVETGMQPKEINNLTINQFFTIFRRIGKFKQYETARLFKTVDASGKIKIIPWSTIDKHNKENEDKLVKLTSLASKLNIGGVDLKNKTRGDL